LSLAGFADVLVACQYHADTDALLEVVDIVASDLRYGAFISLVDGAPLAAGFAQSWAAAHPGLPGSKAYEAKVADLVEMAKSARVEEGAAPVEVQEALLEATARDDVAAVGVILGGRSPEKVPIYRDVCPAAPMWKMGDSAAVSLLATAVFLRARAVTRFLFGFFGVEADCWDLTWAVVSGDEELIRDMWIRVPEASRGVAGLIQVAAEGRHDLVFRWLVGFADESELAVAATLCADNHLATALVALEEAGCDFTNPIAARALARWRAAGVPCVLPENGLPGESLLAWHLTQLVEWQIPMKNPRLVAMGNHFGPDCGPRPELLVAGWLRSTAERILPRWLFGRQRSVLLVETETGVICGGFADGVWVLEGDPADEEMSSTYFVLQHPSGETRKWTKTGADARSATAKTPCPFMCFGAGRLVIYTMGIIATSAGEELSEEDAVFLRGGGQHGYATEARILRWEFWHV
jgi:hypothetical protein